MSSGATTFETFRKIDIRAGTVTRVEKFPEARTLAYKLFIDFGPDIGSLRSSAQITEYYGPDGLTGRQIAAVVNIPPRRIGAFLSEVLVLGFPDSQGRVVLVEPERPVPNGARLF